MTALLNIVEQEVVALQQSIQLHRSVYIQKD